MNSPPASLFSSVHPHQIEVQDFASYALIVDARAAAAFARDHLPGALSVPRTVTADIASVEDLPAALRSRLTGMGDGETVLVYCDRGGLDAQAYAEPMRRAGWTVDVLLGGWGNYRRWVTAGLEVLPRTLALRRLVAPPVSGLCRILALLREQGEQVLDLSELCGQRLVPGFTLPTDRPPSQEAFESTLLEALRRFDPERGVWVRCATGLPDGLALPPALRDRLARCEAIRVEVGVDERARAWLERIQSMHTPVPELLRSLRDVSAPECSRGLERWLRLVGEGQTMEALSAVIDDCIDPSAEDETPSTSVMRLRSLMPDEVAPQLRELVRAHALPAR